MQIADFEPTFGTEWAGDVVYGHAPLHGREHALLADFYFPAARHRPAPLLVWLGAGAFRSGSHSHAGHRRLARWLTHEGIALATPGCRLQAERDDLDPRTLDRLEALEGLRMDEVEPEFASSAALAAMEDIARFLTWAKEHAETCGFAGRPVLAGSSAGAVTALNVGFITPWLGIDRPKPAGIISFSGAFAWPELYEPGSIPVFAVHNPRDDKIDIESVRALSTTDPGLELIEAVEHVHGSLRLWPSEPKPDAYGRVISLVHNWTGSDAPCAAGDG